jgi:DNA-binding XRE family transcriptional regulator/quercetin dioxygenase-like cupin family protein
MSEPRGAALPALGARIRSERLRRGVTVRGLAREIGVSASLVSQIETDKSQPSVSTLYAITSALGIPVEDLFDADSRVPDGDETTSAPPGGDSHATDHGGMGGTGGQGDAGGLDAAETAAGTAQGTPLARMARRLQRAGPVVDPAGREVLTLDSGVTWERLGQLPEAHIDFLLITYAPGGTSSSNGELMRHRGTEFGHMVSGELVLTLGGEDHRLGPGDSVCFDSSLPHRLRNDGDTPAVGVWFVLERG